MRVAVVAESFLPEINGVSRSVARLLAHLRLRGHPALLVAPGSAGAPARGDYQGTPVVRVPALDLPLVHSLPVALPARRVFAAIEAFGPDVVHLASPFVLGAGGLAAARRLGVPAVAVYQTDVAGFADSYGMGWAARAAWRWIRRLHRQADLTLAPSRAAADVLRRHGVPRVALWGRGVDELFHPGRRDDVLRAELAPGGELLVGYVGRLAPEKQVHRLAALSGMGGVRLVIVGDGPTRGELRQLLPDAAFLGMLGGTELATAYASLDVFVHTGPFETFGQTIQEAMACGVAVVAPSAGGPLDLVRHGGTGLLVPPEDDGRHLRAAVATLRDDEATRRAFAAAGRRAVAGRTWTAVCDELLGHYAAVTATGPAADGRGEAA